MDKTKLDTETTPDSVEDGVRGFSMALREAIMDYYKGTCVQGFSSLSQYSVGYTRIPLPNDGTRRNFNYEREEHQRRNPLMYHLDGTIMFELWRDPHTATFHPSIMRRSEELSVAYDQLREFFDKFLPSVTIIEKDRKDSKNYTDGSRDRRLIYRSVSQQISDPQDEEDDDYDADYRGFLTAPVRPQPTGWTHMTQSGSVFQWSVESIRRAEARRAADYEDILRRMMGRD